MRVYDVVPLTSLSTLICHALWVLPVVQVFGAPADSTLDTSSTFSNQLQASLDQLVSASALLNQTQTSKDEPVTDSVLTRTSQDEPGLHSSLISQVPTNQDESVSHSLPISETHTSEDEPTPVTTSTSETETPREQPMSASLTSPEASDLQTSGTNTVSLMSPLSELPTDSVHVAPPSTSESESQTLEADQTKTEVIDASPTWSESSSSSLSLNDYILRLFDPNASYRKCTDVVSSWYDAWRKARQGPTQHSEIHSSCHVCSSGSMSDMDFISAIPTQSYTETEQSASFRFQSDFNDLSDLDASETSEVMSYTNDASLPFNQASVMSELIIPESTAAETMSSSSSTGDGFSVSGVNYTSSSNDRATLESISEMNNVSSTTVPGGVRSSFPESLESTSVTNDIECTDCISPSSVAVTGSTTNITNTFHVPQQTTPLDLIVPTGTMNTEPDLQSSTSEVPTMIVYYNFSGSIVFCETTVPPKVLVSSSSQFLEMAVSDSPASLSSVTSDGSGNSAGGEGTVTDDTTLKSGSNTGGTTAAPGGPSGSTSSGPDSGSKGGSDTSGIPATGLTDPSGMGTGTGIGTSPVVEVISTTPQPTSRKKSNNMSRSVVIGLVCGVAFCVGFLVTCLCFYKFCCNGPSISPQLYNYKPHNLVPSPSPATSHRAKRIFVAD